MITKVNPGVKDLHRPGIISSPDPQPVVIAVSYDIPYVACASKITGKTSAIGTVLLIGQVRLFASPGFMAYRMIPQVSAKRSTSPMPAMAAISPGPKPPSIRSGRET